MTVSLEQLNAMTGTPEEFDTLKTAYENLAREVANLEASPEAEDAECQFCLASDPYDPEDIEHFDGCTLMSMRAAGFGD
jgi:hypothetical protein